MSKISTIYQLYPPKTPIKYRGRVFGITTEIRDNLVYFVFHNGMKIAHNFATCDQIKSISQETMEAYIKKSGKNSLYSYL